MCAKPRRGSDSGPNAQPKSQVDYIMVDEAQDLNPVILGVLRSMQCPVIYVGDPYQQIFPL